MKAQWLSGRVLEAAGSSLTGVTVLCPRARHINPSLVLLQPRKTRPYKIERLLMGRKESNQTKEILLLTTHAKCTCSYLVWLKVLILTWALVYVPHLSVRDLKGLARLRGCEG